MARVFGGATDNCFEYTTYQEGIIGPVSPPMVADVPTARPSSQPCEVVAVGEYAAFARPGFPVLYFPDAYCTLRVNWVDTCH